MSSFANSSAEGLRHVNIPHLVESAVLLVEKELSNRSAKVK